MPYIEEKDRTRLLKVQAGQVMPYHVQKTKEVLTSGDLNYLITSLILEHLDMIGLSYRSRCQRPIIL